MDRHPFVLALHPRRAPCFNAARHVANYADPPKVYLLEAMPAQDECLSQDPFVSAPNQPSSSTRTVPIIRAAPPPSIPGDPMEVVRNTPPQSAGSAPMGPPARTSPDSEANGHDNNTAMALDQASGGPAAPNAAAAAMAGSQQPKVVQTAFIHKLYKCAP